MNYITSIVETIRVPNVAEVEKLHSQLKKDPKFDLKKFEYTHKEVKQKGEVIDEYELVKATLIFNNEKEPDRFVNIEFGIDRGFFPDADVTNTSDDDEDDDEQGGIEF